MNSKIQGFCKLSGHRLQKLLISFHRVGYVCLSDLARFYDRFLECHLTATCWIILIQGLNFTTFKEILQFYITFMNSVFFEDFVFRIQRILEYPWIQMFADWSCTVLFYLISYFCNSLISVSGKSQCVNFVNYQLNT